MSDEFSQYRAINFKKDKDDFSQYHASNFRKKNVNQDEQLNALREQHPVLMKLAEKLQGNKALESAGNIAGHFNNALEGTGLPSAAKGFFGTGISAGRGLANLIPGVNIQEQQYPELNVNPYVGKGAETIGSFAAMPALFKGYQAAKSGMNAIPYVKNIPDSLKAILAGTGFGAAISPDNRGLGAALGGLSEAVPLVANKIKDLKPDAFSAIQKGYDSKLKNASSLIENTGKEAEKLGITKIPIRKTLVDDIKAAGPKKKSFTMLMDKIKTGDYQALRKAQTELFQRAEKLKSGSIADQDLGDVIHDLRDEINQSIFNHFKNKGHPELANKLQKGMSQYKNLIDTYHSTPQIAKLVGKSKIVPSKSTILKRDSVEMNQLKMHHPEIEKQLKFEKNLNRAIKAAVGTGTLGGLVKAKEMFVD